MLKRWIILLLFVTSPHAIYADHMLHGDLNGDGNVDFADFLIFAGYFNKPPSQIPRVSHTLDTIIVRDTLTVTTTKTIRDTLIVTNTVHDTITITKTVTVTDTIHLQSENSQAQPPQIIIEPGGGLGTTPVFHYGFESIRDVFASKLASSAESDIIVRQSPFNHPRVLYERGPNGEHQVLLQPPQVPSFALNDPNFEVPYWQILIDQFAHEYGHILANYRDAEGYKQPKWFEESIAMIASLVALRTLSAEWEQNPPGELRAFQNNVPYIKEFLQKEMLRAGIIENGFSDGPSIHDPQSLGSWHSRSWASFIDLDPSSAPSRHAQGIVARMLLDLFETYPNDAWNAVRYMNTWPPSNSNSTYIRDYLVQWRKYTPKQWQYIVTEIMRRFAIG